MKKSFILTIAALSIFALFSCKKGSSDVTKPVINFIEPKEGSTLIIGDNKGVRFEMKISDNEALASYKIDVHNNFDNHSHSKADAATTPFSFKRTYYSDVTGKKNASIQHNDIRIPANATPGNYHIVVYVTDAAGNESFVARSVTLANSTATTVNDHDNE